MNFLLDLKQVAAGCSIDESTALRWTATGLLPEPQLIDGLPRWYPATLERWALAGCPASKPLHHSTMHAIRKGWLEDSFRTNPEMEIDEL